MIDLTVLDKNLTPELISEALNCDVYQAKKIRNLITGNQSPENYLSVKKWIDLCYNTPSRHELLMEAFNEILEAYGQEPMYMDGLYISNYYQNIACSYVNMGYTYIPTIIFDYYNKKFYIASWGDYYENYEQINPEYRQCVE